MPEVKTLNDRFRQQIENYADEDWEAAASDVYGQLKAIADAQPPTGGPSVFDILGPKFVEVFEAALQTYPWKPVSAEISLDGVTQESDSPSGQEMTKDVLSREIIVASIRNTLAQTEAAHPVRLSYESLTDSEKRRAIDAISDRVFRFVTRDRQFLDMPFHQFIEDSRYKKLEANEIFRYFQSS